MRLPFLLILLIAVLFGSGYWYTIFDTTCVLPIQYRIGEVDPRFGTDREELMRIAQRAESIWETPLGKELFVYNESEGIPVNLVFDERQENAEIEAELREDLESKQGMSESVASEYDRLIAEFRKLSKSYESRVASYESRLAGYNETVAEWNARGGAPEPVIGELQDEEESIRKEQDALEALAKKLNELVRQLNQIGARGNVLIKDYNTIVNEYNDQVSGTGEFTQGDYTGEAISVYQFNSEEELVIVLAHEFGHALSLGHVENEESIMYHHMGAQQLEKGLTTEDIASFGTTCTEPGGLEKMLRFIASLV